MEGKFKRLSVLAAGAALVLALGGCDGSSAKGDTIKIGGNLEMTGGGASYGISSKNAIELAIKQLNEKGGVNGKKLSLVVADNKSEATEATNAMQKLVTQDKVVGVIGPNLSSAVIAASSISGGAKVPDITPMGTRRWALRARRRYSATTAARSTTRTTTSTGRRSWRGSSWIRCT